MSSPIAIPRRAPSPARSESETSSSSLSTASGLYVPLHKRAASVSSSGSVASAASSPSSTSSSWRTHTPANPKAAFSSASRKVQGHKKPINPPSNDAAHSKRAGSRIPIVSQIPTTPINPPFVYPIVTLLALSGAPAPLSTAQVERVRAVLAFIPTAAAATASALAPKPESADKAAAPRRRRVGRARKNTVSQKKTASKTADVEVRRARHGGPHAHGTWGWNAHAPHEAFESHQHNLEEPWRHTPVVSVSAA